MGRLKLKGVVGGDSRVGWVIDPPARVDVGVEVSAGSPSRRGIHWQLSDPVFNEIIVDFELETGALRGMEILFLRDSVVHPLGRSEVAAPERNAVGVPAFSLDVRPDVLDKALRAEGMYFHAVSGRCRFESGGDELRVVLFPDAIGHCVATTDGRLRCEFNETEELCAFTISGLSQVEKESLVGERFGKALP